MLNTARVVYVTRVGQVYLVLLRPDLAGIKVTLPPHGSHVTEYRRIPVFVASLVRRGAVQIR